MPVKLLSAVLIIIFGALGCANQVPVAENFSTSTQKKLRATQHWDVIAADIVHDTAQALKHNDALSQRPVFVEAAPTGPTSFNRAFREFMISGLVNNGILVTENPGAAVIVKYNTQVVKHRADRKYSPLLSLGLVSKKLYEPNRSADHGSVASILTDGPTDTELIVNTSIMDNGHYYMRKSSVYYVDGEDIRLFLPQWAWTKDWKVVGP